MPETPTNNAMDWTVFYAWQTDSPNNTNRGLILQALEAALKEVRAGGELTESPRLDRDTMDVPGSPDIETTIFAKIDRAAVFVADVTNVTKDPNARPSPNPNVLIELGYALKALGPERIIMVLNTAFGSPEKLPFDIRRKRALTYNLPPDAQDKAPERKVLQKRITEALRASLARVEQAQPRVVAPSPAEALITAVAAQAPAQRPLVRRYVAAVLEALDALKPTSGVDDDALVAAIEASKPLVTTFTDVARSLASHRSQEALEELHHLFEKLLIRYDVSRGFSGTSYVTAFDFYKFVGHELFVILTAVILEEEAWDLLGYVLALPLSVTGGSRPDRVASFEEISVHVRLLDEIRKEKKREGRVERISIRADMLQARYASGEMGVAWEQFCAADYLLYMRSYSPPSEEVIARVWRPWSVLYLDHLPQFVVRSTAKAYAARVAVGLGLAGPQQLGEHFRAATKQLEKFYRSSGYWDPPGERHDWTKIASI